MHPQPTSLAQACVRSSETQSVRMCREVGEGRSALGTPAQVRTQGGIESL